MRPLPACSLGQHFLGGRAWEKHPVATLMAAALPSHMTFFTDLRKIPADVIEQVRPWTRFYTRHRRLLTQLTYPLLDDPLEQRWTALQSWKRRRGRGALPAFRRQDERESVEVQLRDVPAGQRFLLRRAPDGGRARVVTSRELRGGLRVAAAGGLRVAAAKDAPEIPLITRLRAP